MTKQLLQRIRDDLQKEYDSTTDQSPDWYGGLGFALNTLDEEINKVPDEPEHQVADLIYVLRLARRELDQACPVAIRELIDKRLARASVEPCEHQPGQLLSGSMDGTGEHYRYQCSKCKQPYSVDAPL